MIEPVMDLELDPRSREKVQCSRWFEILRLSRHESQADFPGTWVPQLIFCRLLTILAIEATPKSHASTSHLPQLEGVICTI